MRSALALVLSVVPAVAAAEPRTLLAGAESQQVSAALGIDRAAGVVLGYAVGVTGPRAVVVFAEMMWVAGTLELGDFRTRAGVELDLHRPSTWGLRGRLATSVARSEQQAFDTTAIGAELAVLGGRFGDDWAAALELGASRLLATRVAPTAWYRDHFYRGARDGWYSAGGTVLRFGSRAAICLGSFEVGVAAGVMRSGPYEFLPGLYAQLGTGWRF